MVEITGRYSRLGKTSVISRSQGDLHREPPTRVPYGKMSLGTFFLPLLRFSDDKGFRHLRMAT
jgi:hypothetical protein